MEIKLPIQAKGLNLNDREKILAWLITESFAALYSPVWDQYSLNFYKKDLNIVLGNQTMDMGDLEKIFKFGYIDKQNTLISFINPIKALHNGPAARHPKTYMDKITDSSLFLIYAYLIGRVIDRRAIFDDDNDNLFREKGRSLNYNLTHIVRTQSKDGLPTNE